MAGFIKVKLPLAVWVAIGVVPLVCYGLLGGIYAWRINTFEHAIATVVSVRTVEKPWRKGSARYITSGELSFTRTAKDGTAIHCQHEFDIGHPQDGYKGGDRFEVVVATGSCQRLDIIGPIGGQQ